MMKRVLYGLMIGLATFALGLGAASIWNARRPISLCELDANPKYYAGKTIRFRAVIDKGQSRLSAGAFCANGEVPMLSIDLDPDEEAEIFAQPSFRARDDKDSNITLIDSEVVGQLDSFIGPGCFGPKYNVTNARVERLFSTHQFSDSQEAVLWLKSNSY